MHVKTFGIKMYLVFECSVFWPPLYMTKESILHSNYKPFECQIKS